MFTLQNLFRSVTKDEAIKLIRNTRSKNIIVCFIDFDEGINKREEGVDKERIIKLFEGSKLIQYGLTRGIINNLNIYYMKQEPEHQPIGKMNSILF